MHHRCCCLCTIDAFQILSDSDLIFCREHQQPRDHDAQNLPKQRAKSSQAVQPPRLQIRAVCSHLLDILLSLATRVQSPRAKIKPTKPKIAQARQGHPSETVKTRRCDPAVVWKGHSGPGRVQTVVKLKKNTAAQNAHVSLSTPVISLHPATSEI